jgi:hypothetical protein
MASKEELNRAVRLVAGALTKYAKQHHWKDTDYSIYYEVNEEWDRIHFVFVAKGFDGRDNFDCYRSVWRFLERELDEEQDVLESLGLVVRSKEQIDEGGIYQVGPQYEEYWTVHPTQQR